MGGSGRHRMKNIKKEVLSNHHYRFEKSNSAALTFL